MANLGFSCHSYISIDTAEDARRVVDSEWPGVTHVKDIRSVSEETVLEWRDKSPSAKYMVSLVGFPCQDISGANPGRQGLGGARSGFLGLYSISTR